MAEVIKLPSGQLMAVTSKTYVNDKAIINTIQAIINNGMKKVGQTVTNKIVSRSLPNNPQSGKNPGKKNINMLRQRIKSNFLGKNNDFLTAQPNNEGKPIWSEAEGATSLPVVVVKKFRGRPGKGRKVNKPDKVFEPMALVSYIKRFTTMEKKKSVAMRKLKKGADFVWTTKDNLVRAMKVFQMRAGNNIFGWSSLANEVKSAAISKSINNTSSLDSPGGTGKFSNSGSTIKLTATNTNAPAPTETYQQRVIDVNIGKWVDFAFKNELKYLTPQQLIKGAKIPPDVHVTWN